jgi:hypothetical protein
MQVSGSRTIRAGALALLASVIVTMQDGAYARNVVVSCGGTTEIVCYEPGEGQDACPSQSAQNHICNLTCGPTWHADDCVEGLGPCAPDQGGIVCHRAGGGN